MSLQGVLRFSSLNIPDFLFIWAAAALLNMMNALCLSELGITFLLVQHLITS